jgi:hypothetical protein
MKKIILKSFLLIAIFGFSASSLFAETNAAQVGCTGQKKRECVSLDGDKYFCQFTTDYQMRCFF